MTTLILAVDRDNDYGTKIGVKGPVIGRDACLNAATRLALTDPEDADANGVFAAIQEFDARSERGERVALALLLGDADVGAVSDATITRQLDDAVAVTGATAAFAVLDGAEDADVLPLVRSRVRVDGTRRVVVAQHAGLESFLVALSKGVESPKVQKRYVIPFSVILIVFGILAATGNLSAAFAAVTLGFALYLIVRMLRTLGN